MESRTACHGLSPHSFIQAIHHIIAVSTVGNNHQEIKVAVWRYAPCGGGANKNNPRGINQPHDLVKNLFDVVLEFPLRHVVCMPKNRQSGNP